MRSLNRAIFGMATVLVAIAASLLLGLPFLALGITTTYLGLGLVAIGLVSMWWPTMLLDPEDDNDSYSVKNILFIYFLWPTLWYAVSTYFMGSGKVEDEWGRPIFG